MSQQSVAPPAVSVKATCRRALALGVLVLAAGTASLAPAAADPQALYERAVGRIDAYVDGFRRSFDRTAGLDALTRAEQELQESVRLSRRSDAATAARSLVRIGDIRRYRDQWQAANAAYREAGELAQRGAAPDAAAKALMGEARVALYGHSAASTALALAQRALDPARASGDPSQLFDAYDLLAQAQIAQGDLAGAADALNRAFALEQDMPDDKLLYYGHLDRAEIYQKLTERCDYERDFSACFDAAERAQRDYRAALEKAQKLGWNGLAKQTEGFLSRLAIRVEMLRSQQRLHELVTDSGTFQPRSARDVLVTEKFAAGANPMLDGLLRWIEGEGGLPVADDARGAYVRGLFSEMTGDGDAALRWYRKATELLEGDRRNLHDERARGSFLADKVDFYYTYMLNLLDRRQYPEAFDAMERSRARVMSDLLASKRLSLSDPQHNALYSQLQQLRSRIARQQDCLFALRAARPDPAACQDVQAGNTPGAAPQRGAALVGDGGADDRHRAEDVAAGLAVLQHEHEALATRIRTMAPRLGELTTADPISLQQLQALLGQDRSELLAYLALESQLVVWHVSPDAARAYSVFLPRSELARKVQRLRDSLVSPRTGFDATTAHELYLYLLGPVIERIGADRLVIVPHEDLHYVPFQALPMAAGGEFVGERFAISYAPSASVFAALAPPQPLQHPELLAVADPTLAHAPGEVRGIGGLFSGRVLDDALPTEAELRQLLPGRGLVHLAVHGRYADHEPLLSHLYLRAGAGDDGHLTAAEMYGLPLDDAQLVVLSACETGTVKATHANEILGMQRGLLFAGADALLLSAWKIDDAATAEWMKAFYGAATALPPASAARAAIRALRRNPAYRHPYYWAPFLLTGR